MKMVFGQRFELLPDSPIPNVPKFLWDATQHLIAIGGLSRPQIFRESISKHSKDELIAAIQGGLKTIYDIEEPIAVGELIKSFLMMAPESILTDECLDRMYENSKTAASDFALLGAVIPVLACLPQRNQRLLEYVLHFLHQVAANAAVNKMGSEALGIVFGPSLVRIGMQTSNALQKQIALNSTLRVMIEHIAVYQLIPDLPLMAGNLIVTNPDGRAKEGHNVSLAGAYLHVITHIKLSNAIVGKSAKSAKEWTVKAGDKKYRFKCDTAEEAASWVNAVGTCIATCRAASLPPRRVSRHRNLISPLHSTDSTTTTPQLTVTEFSHVGAAPPLTPPPNGSSYAEAMLARRRHTFMSAPSLTSFDSQPRTGARRMSTGSLDLEQAAVLDAQMNALSVPVVDDETTSTDPAAASKLDVSDRSPAQKKRNSRTFSQRLNELPRPPSSAPAEQDNIPNLLDATSSLIDLTAAVRQRLLEANSASQPADVKESISMSQFALNSAETLMDEMRWTIRRQQRESEHLNSTITQLLEEIHELRVTKS